METPQNFSVMAERIGLPAYRYFDSVNSTNLEGLSWLKQGGPDGAIVFADHQSAGRGRFERQWITNPGSAIAVSILIHPTEDEQQYPALFSPLAGLALATVLREKYDIKAEIKWPNDVLINHQKTAGILSEASWDGTSISGLVVGCGINILAESIPAVGELKFPATCIQAHVKKRLDRFELLEAYLETFFRLRKTLTTTNFINQWEKILAFRGEKVYIKGNDSSIKFSGTIIGIAPDGDLKLLTAGNQIETISAGDVHLRPAANNETGRP